MNHHGDGKPEPANPIDAVRLLELELMQQRAVRQHAGAPYRGLRAASLFFLFVVVVGALLAFYYVFYAGGLDEYRSRSAPDPSQAAQTTPSP
jgi:hypothetical protein